MTEISTGSLLLIALLILGVVGSVVVVTAEHPTEVYLTVRPRLDYFFITFNPEQMYAAQGETKTTKVTFTSWRIMQTDSSKYDSADVSLSISPNSVCLGTCYTASLSSQLVHLDSSPVGSPPSKSVSLTIKILSSSPSKTVSVIVAAAVSWSSYSGESPKTYEGACGIGISVSWVPTTTAATTVKIADTWIQTTLRFGDGHTSLKKTGRSALVSLDLPLVQQLQDMKIEIPVQTYDITNDLPQYPGGIGPQYWSIEGKTTVKVTVNGVTALGPLNFETKKVCLPSSVSILSGRGYTCDSKVGELFTLAQASFNVVQWAQQQKLSKGTYSIDVSVDETYVVFVWIPVGGSIWTPHNIGTTLVSFPQHHDFPWDPSNPQGQATFTIDASPQSLILGTKSGNIDKFLVSVLAGSGFTGTVKFTVSDLPSGITGSFKTPSQSLAPGALFGTELSIACSSNAKLGDYTITIKATSTSPSWETSISRGLVIQENGSPQTVIKTDSHLTLQAKKESVKPGTTIQLYGTLQTSGSVGISGAKVTITPSWNESKSVSVQTNANGEYGSDLKAPMEEGIYAVSADFSGNAQNNRDSDSVNISVNSQAGEGGGNGSSDLWQRFMDWLKGSTCVQKDPLGLICLFAIPNWIIFGVAALIVLWLLFRRGGSGVVVVTGGGGV